MDRRALDGRSDSGRNGVLVPVVPMTRTLSLRSMQHCSKEKQTIYQSNLLRKIYKSKIEPYQSKFNLKCNNHGPLRMNVLTHPVEVNRREKALRFVYDNKLYYK